MRNLGRFILSDLFVRSEAYWVVMKHIRILEADYDVFRNGYYYIGCSDLFDLVAAGEEIPEYKIMIDTNMKVIVTKC